MSRNPHSVLNNEEVQAPILPGVPNIEGADFTKEHFYQKSIDLYRQEQDEQQVPSDQNAPRSVYIMRHGERIDFVFGSWVPYCFQELGTYARKDLNMPKSLPERKGGADAYLRDSPLSNIGQFEAKLVGESLRDTNISIDKVYCSPSYRCIQTCDSLLRGMNRRDLPIKVEPGLFEWMAWYPLEYVPQWMTITELTKAGFNIDETYVPLVSEKEIKENKENCEQFYLRSAFVTRSCLSNSPKGNVLLVGHTSTLDTCSRELTGNSARSGEELIELIKEIPYCALVEVTDRGNGWEMVEPPCLPLTHSTNQRFDWKLLL